MPVLLCSFCVIWFLRHMILLNWVSLIVPKTTDFEMLQSMLIVPSLLHHWSSRERNFKKWCLCDEEEAEEVRHFCKTMLVHPNMMNICSFSSQFFTHNQATQDVCTEGNEFKKKSILTGVRPSHSLSRKFILQQTINITTRFHISFSLITGATLFVLVI